MADSIEIPLFPLSTVVLFPGMRAPLHIFEPRYRQMMEAALDGDRVIGMATVLPEHHDSMGEDPPLFEVGCAGFVRDHQRLADGRYNLLLEATWRFRIEREIPRDEARLFRLAEVEPLDECSAAPEGSRAAELRENVLDSLRTLVGSNGKEELPVDRFETLADDAFTNALCQLLGLPTEDKQGLLEAAGPGERLIRLEGLLQYHLARSRGPRGTGSDKLH